jgi:hypothetical protein
MTQKLTDMQLVLLSTACQREDGSLLPPHASLGTQAARIRKAVAALIKRALASECDIAEKVKAWRDEGERHIGVVITDTGRAVIAAEEQGKATNSVAAEVITANPEPTPSERLSTKPEPAPRTGTKQALVLDMLRRAEGANLNDLVSATGWLPHTTRAALTGLRKKGHSIEKAKRNGTTTYMIAAA